MKYDHLSLLPVRSFRLAGNRMTYEGSGKSDSPETPDYTAAAQATAQGNVASAYFRRDPNQQN